MTLNQIKKLENLNDISINVYCMREEEKNLDPSNIRLIDKKMDKMLIFCTYDNRTLYVDQESASWARNSIDTRNNNRTQEILLQ